MYTYQPAPLSDVVEVFLSAGVFDGAGREVGFTLGWRDTGYQFFAWVQNSRRENGYFYDFGLQSPVREFSTQSQSIGWAYRVARERIARVQAVRLNHARSTA